MTIPASGGHAEAARLEALRGYRILDTPPEQDFDDLVELAAAVCDTPVAAIAFVDGHRSWLKAKRGVEVWELPRDTALSAETLLHTDVFEVSDARRDVRYQSSQVVSHGFRFFAGMPLVSPEGHALGTVCVLDRRPRELSVTQKDGLRAIARQVMSQLELRRVSQPASSARDKFRQLVEQLPGAVYIEDLGASSGSYFSPQVEWLTGYSADEWASEPEFFSRVLFPEDRDRVLAAFARAHETHTPIQIEYRLVTKDGRVVWIQDDAAVARNSDGQPEYFQGLLTDITEAHALTVERDGFVERLRDQNERLLDVDRIKDELLAMVSHELRTPLTSILGYLELVREDSALTDDQSTYLGVIDNNARRLLSLVSDLLFVAHAQANPVVLEQDVVDLSGIVEQAVMAAQPAAASRGVDLTLHSSGGADVIGDAQRLGQVMDNLLSNAVKFTSAGGSVGVRLGVSGERVLIEVADTGMGITAADQEALFVRFFRTESARKSAIHGTGLGLSIIKTIVDAHGGEITVDSAEGEGTTFRVFLPKTPFMAERSLDDADWAEGVEHKGEQDEPLPGTQIGVTHEGGNKMIPRTRPLVLIVDDDEEILELVRLRLSRFGYDTVVAHDGLEALAVARASQPNLALVDVTMPAMDGYGATRQLKRDPATKHIPVILLTAMAEGAAITRGFEAGADDYITKPFSPQALESRVAAVLERAAESTASATVSQGIRLAPSA